MADILIRGIDFPQCCGECPFQASRWTGDFCSAGQFMIEMDFDYRDKHPKCPLVPLPAGHGELIERKALNLFHDYKEVRNGIKQTIKATERDGRTITGITIELLKQTFVALDSLRSVRRYFLNAKTIVPADATDIDVGSKSEGGSGNG